MKTLDFISVILNLTGMVLNMLSAIKLFKMKVEPIDIKYDPDLKTITWIDENEGYEALSQAIEQANKKNKTLRESSVKWFVLTIIGFFLQFGSVALPTLSHNPACDDSENKTEETKSHHSESKLHLRNL